MKQVTQEDFIIQEFRGKDPNDYEFRSDGKIVRKNRWEQGFRAIASIFVNPRADFEIDDIITRVKIATKNDFLSGSILKAAKLMTQDHWFCAFNSIVRCRYCQAFVPADSCANDIIHMENCPVKIIKDYDKN